MPKNLLLRCCVSPSLSPSLSLTRPRHREIRTRTHVLWFILIISSILVLRSPTSTATTKRNTEIVMSTNKNVSAAHTQAPGTVRNAAMAGFSSPIYRGELTHGASAELQEGYRILTNGQKVNIISDKDLLKAIQASGLRVTEEEVNDLLRVVHQDERTLGLEFSEFMMLMTKEMDDQVMDEMRSAFHSIDKNNTGTVTKKQFTELFVSVGEHSSAEELDELLLLAEVSEDSETVDYNKLITELAIRLNKM
ncbi:putative ef-hand protein 5 [Leptomonas pyrrhocoris]|uniref:Putative ef-hand protein 5 n=1 Tax=Leptomonas pyrrhocoris TaxID=157538 RepID=A0A0N0DTU6_LEPPY|nr:putative ef-hand protein 5 [Leptomonas pyrrhocoris]KPA77604.1 putative ef-hand protein 5 [Leptomonas pyrrhocoris]|eukprot:XP_015656043.1 putative ef-hand protein 5 [Leptomonas pyrrhocoris]